MSFSSLAPRRGPRETPEQFLEIIKEGMMGSLHIEEDVWQELAAEALIGLEDARAAMELRPAEVLLFMYYLDCIGSNHCMKL